MKKTDDFVANFAEVYALMHKGEFFIAGEVAALNLLEALEFKEVLKNKFFIEQLIELDKSLAKCSYANQGAFKQGFLGILQVSVH